MLIPVSLAILYAWHISRDEDRSPPGDMACISVGSLLLINHLIYDYIFLIAPLAYAFQKMRGPMRWAMFGIVGFFWYVETLGALSFEDPAIISPTAGLCSPIRRTPVHFRAGHTRCSVTTPCCAQAAQPT